MPGKTQNGGTRLPYDVIVARPAAKELAKLSKDAQKKIVEALEGLRTEPRPTGTFTLDLR